MYQYQRWALSRLSLTVRESLAEHLSRRTHLPLIGYALVAEI